MANRTVAELHALVIETLPASGGMTIPAFEAALPEVDRHAAMGQVQQLKLSRKVKTWLETDASGTTTVYIGRK